MRYLRWLAVGLLIALSACETKNVGPGHGPPPPLSFSVTLSPSQPTGGYVAGEAVTANITFFGSPPPFSFTLSFPNGGATPATQTFDGSYTGYCGTAVANFVIDAFLLAEDPDGKYLEFAILGTNGVGYVGQYYGSFYVNGIPCQPPVIDALTVNGTQVTVSATDSCFNDDLTITWTADGGLTGSPQSAIIEDGSGSTTFTFTGDDLFGGNSGTVTFTATDQGGGTNTASATVTIPALVLNPDTLYAIPLQATVNAGDPVRIVVASGDPANPFFYMTAVRVTVPQAADALYVGGDPNFGGTGDIPGSFNIGAVGGVASDPDGVWEDQGASSFLLPPDSFYRRNVAASGLHAFDFNLTPLDGSDMDSGAGELFNFELVFQNPGTYTLGFEEFDVIRRTYYQDTNQAPDYYWGDISNDHTGIPNSVTVN